MRWLGICPRKRKRQEKMLRVTPFESHGLVCKSPQQVGQFLHRRRVEIRWTGLRPPNTMEAAHPFLRPACQKASCAGWKHKVVIPPLGYSRRSCVLNAASLGMAASAPASKKLRNIPSFPWIREKDHKMLVMCWGDTCQLKT